MSRAAIGFYWTLPVPWAGFTRLPKDIDAAAAKSRTIAYQRALILRYAAEAKLHLVDERVFLEVAPDRGTRQVQEPLRKLEALCRAKDAMLLYVDFAELAGWRKHSHLADWAAQTGIETLPVAPEPVPLGGAMFDPRAHFAAWRLQQTAWTEGKPARAAAARARATALRAEGRTLAATAAALEAEGLRSPTGRRWTAVNLRKFLAAPSGAGEA